MEDDECYICKKPGSDGFTMDGGAPFPAHQACVDAECKKHGAMRTDLATTAIAWNGSWMGWWRTKREVYEAIDRRLAHGPADDQNTLRNELAREVGVLFRMIVWQEGNWKAQALKVADMAEPLRQVERKHPVIDLSFICTCDGKCLRSRTCIIAGRPEQGVALGCNICEFLKAKCNHEYTVYDE